MVVVVVKVSAQGAGGRPVAAVSACGVRGEKPVGPLPQPFQLLPLDRVESGKASRLVVRPHFIQIVLQRFWSLQREEETLFEIKILMKVCSDDTKMFICQRH